MGGNNKEFIIYRVERSTHRVESRTSMLEVNEKKSRNKSDVFFPLHLQHHSTSSQTITNFLLPTSKVGPKNPPT